MEMIYRALILFVFLCLVACAENRNGSKTNTKEIPKDALYFEDEIEITPPLSAKPPPPPPQPKVHEILIQERFTQKSKKMIPTSPAVGDLNIEEYQAPEENSFQNALETPLSTFSIDVDNASYSNCRRYLSAGNTPPPAAVRVEEFINYFDYDYPQPKKGAPFSINTEISDCPWAKGHKLVHIGLQGKELSQQERQPSNLTFLIDVSGSMSDENKLPLLKKSFRLLLNQLQSNDRVAIVVYAGSSGVVLPSTMVRNKTKILAALENLSAGGSTAGGEGIELAYKIAEQNLLKRGNNRIILATDGDFNVGMTNTKELVKLMEEKRQKGIYLTALGFGMGDYKDHRMEQIADNGNGTYAYIDDLREAKKIFVNELTGTLFTIAKDVKIQIEFNPAKVKEYRLIGYENRKLAARDFNDDKKDAGELGAGHTVTALYEIIPAFSDESQTVNRNIDPLKYQSHALNEEANKTSEWMTVKLRYKKPREDESKLLVTTLENTGTDWAATSENFRFSAAVAGFAMLLRHSEYKGDLTYTNVAKWASAARSKDEHGYRAEFIDLVETTGALQSEVTVRR